MAFETVEAQSFPEAWNKKGNINLGDSIEGVYIKKDITSGKYGETVYYQIETKDGVKSIIGSTDIRNKMDQIEIGKLVRITFKEYKETDKGSPMKVYEVQVDNAA